MFMCNKFYIESNKILLSKATYVYLIFFSFNTIMALNDLTAKFNLRLIRLINGHIM